MNFILKAKLKFIILNIDYIAMILLLFIVFGIFTFYTEYIIINYSSDLVKA